MADIVLGIESSCDESAISLLNPSIGFVGEWINTQISLQETYGGVVPDLASREHLLSFGTLQDELLKITKPQYIKQIAVTYGPGLSGSLAMGIAFAKSLSLAWNIPLVGVNHLRGHAYSPFIYLHKEDPDKFKVTLDSLLPHLGLLVSGGNTILFKIDKSHKFTILGQTLDDASGEALDKGAKLMGMAYPGGPLIEKVGEGGDVNRFHFPRAFENSSELKFSFSGLKTSLRYMLEKLTDEDFEKYKKDLCASYQEAVVDQLVSRTHYAISPGEYKSIGLSGGVANNKRLRFKINELANRHTLPLYIAEPKYTRDNASMIAFAAYANPGGVLETDLDTLVFNSSLTLC